MPKISVIIPVYGVEKYIERCARSLFEQTLDDIEYIFVDDCTKDHSLDVLQEVLLQYSHRKNQVKIVRHKENRGLPLARQTGLTYAMGEYIAHCDSDDWVDTKMYEKLYEKAVEEDADVVMCDYYEGDEINQKRHSIKPIIDVKQLMSSLLLHKTPVSVWNKIIKRNFYEDLNFKYPSNNFGEDFALMIQLIDNVKYVSYVQEPLYFYYRNPSSITKTKTREQIMRNWRDMSANINIVKDYLTKKDDYVKYEREFWILEEQCRKQLLPIISDDSCSKLFLDAYPKKEFSFFLFKDSEKRSFVMDYYLVKYNLYIPLRNIKRIIAGLRK